MPIIFGINPVLEALQAGNPVDKIYILNGKEGTAIHKIYLLAKKQQVRIVRASRTKLENLAEGKKHQGVVCILPVIDYIPLEYLIEKVQKYRDDPNILIVDRINDPHNFGAIIRSAEVLGVHGIVFAVNDTVPITDTVVKASAGAIFHMNMCKVSNINQSIKYMKECGLWIYASSSHAEKSLWNMDFMRPQALIIGSEAGGVRKSLLKNSDEIFRIPQEGKIESLNASVATGIILTEVLRQRLNIKI